MRVGTYIDKFGFGEGWVRVARPIAERYLYMLTSYYLKSILFTIHFYFVPGLPPITLPPISEGTRDHLVAHQMLV